MYILVIKKEEGGGGGENDRCSSVCVIISKATEQDLCLNIFIYRQ